MLLVAPDYYTDFVCIADKCRHSCCIGWEIDIDEDTAEYYKNYDGPLADRFKSSIDFDSETPHFILAENQRCPFLDKNGLCDIIAQLGEGALCQICDDHPRYRNFYSDRTETGIGLCCEAAGKLILSRTEKTEIVAIEGDNENLYPEEEELISVRQQIFDILQDRSLSIDKRVQNMLDFCEIELPGKTVADWADIYMSLESLDKIWGAILAELKAAETSALCLPQNRQYETAFEQLSCYFVYRHLTDSLDDDRFWQRVAFAALSYVVIRSVCGLWYNKNGKLDIDDIVEIARIYSSEVEYSQDNMDILLEILT